MATVLLWKNDHPWNLSGRPSFQRLAIGIVIILTLGSWVGQNKSGAPSNGGKARVWLSWEVCADTVHTVDTVDTVHTEHTVLTLCRHCADTGRARWWEAHVQLHCVLSSVCKISLGDHVGENNVQTQPRKCTPFPGATTQPYSRWQGLYTSTGWFRNVYV